MSPKRLNVQPRNVQPSNVQPSTRPAPAPGGRYAPYGFRFASASDRTLLPDPDKGPAREAILTLAGNATEQMILNHMKKNFPHAAPGGGWTVTKIRDIIWREARKKGMS